LGEMLQRVYLSVRLRIYTLISLYS
jgi:hypothetical protein